jgi:hypothetical protein
MALRRLPWVAAGLVVLTACSGGAPNLVMRPTTPPGGSSALQRAARTAPTLAGLAASPWGKVPVVAPGSLRSTADAYYDGAGPNPEDPALGGPACLLLAPTVLGSNVQAVPSSTFDVFGHFVVTWSLTHRRGAALTLEVVAPGDPSDQPYFDPAARVTTFADGSQLRMAPRQPRDALIRIPIENCEYEVQPGTGLPATSDAAILTSLRLIYAP